MLTKVNPVETEAWKSLQDHFSNIKSTRLTDLFKEEDRCKYLTFEFEGICFDFSKNFIDKTSLDLFKSLAEAVHLDDAKKAMFSGSKINETEDRAVLHVALRNKSNSPIMVNNRDVMPLVNTELAKMKTFVDGLHEHKLLGYTGKPLTNIINIGISCCWKRKVGNKSFIIIKVIIIIKVDP